MGSLEVFVLRIILAAVLAFFISRLFFPSAPLVKVFGLALGMLAAAYVLRYFRMRRKGGTHGE